MTGTPRPPIRAATLTVFLGAVIAGLLVGCSDLGDPFVPVVEPETDLPQLSELIPARTFSGDTLTVLGTGFGKLQKEQSVVFGSTAIEATVLSWSESEVLVEVPAGIGPGPIAVRDGERLSNALTFATASEVSFAQDIVPLFQARGCESCHFGSSGTNGFSVLSPLEIITGGQRGPGAIPRRAEESLLVRIIRGLDGLPQMPFRSDALPASEIEKIEDWIYQGARDN